MQHIFTRLLLVLVPAFGLGCGTKNLDITLGPADSGIADVSIPDAVVPPAVDAGFLEPDTGVLPTEDAGQAMDAGVNDCDGPLSYDGLQTAVLALDSVVFSVSGGSRSYRFTLLQNGSGAILNSVSGQYLAGPNAGTVDKIKVTDELCPGELMLDMRVVLPMDVRPSDFSIPRGGVFTFEVYEGSGDFEFIKLSQTTTSTLTPTGTYTAGDEIRTDRIQITDTQTQEIREITISVVDGVSIDAQTQRLFLAMGHEHLLQVEGGSGWFDIVSSSTVARVDGELRIYGDSPGLSTLTVSDRFINGVSTTLDVHVVVSHAFTATVGGDYVRESKIAAPGDLNGDGFEDVVVGIGDADVSSYNSGAIFVYAGGPNGLSTTPSQVVSSYVPDGRMGYSFEIRDFDRDGQKDLLAAIPFNQDPRDLKTGGVELYRGVANGFFETTPSMTWRGDYSYDYFGQSVTACDFNNDGLLDFAVSAYAGEDRVPRPIYYTQGQVKVFLQRPSGFLQTADADIYGQVFDPATGFTSFTDLQMGRQIDSGDFDGDGVCDLVASTWLYRSPNGGSRNGLIYVYRGREASSADFGGISALPEIGFRSGLPGETNSYFGRYLEVADLNQDGKDDIIASEQDYSGDFTRNGAVRVFAGRTLADAPLTELIWSDQADFSVFGDSNDDRLGYFVSSGDYDDDGIIDLLAFAWQGESRGGPVNAGTIHGYRGQLNAWPSLVPTATIAPGRSYDRFGISFALAGDLDRDGENDMVAYCSESDFVGLNAGGAYVVSGTTTPTAEVLQMPQWQPAGDHFGYGVSMLDDINGDGYADMLAGAPYLNDRTLGVSIGGGFVYLGGPNGFSYAPDQSLTSFRRHSGGDYFGWAVADAGDFDRARDPLFSTDIAMLARHEDHPGSFSSNNYVLDGNCRSGYISNTGMVGIWSGSSSGLPDGEPDFMYFGPQSSDGLRHLLGGFNFNGDAYDDLAVSSLEWDFTGPNANDAGGVALIAGRAPDPTGKITVICEESLFVRGRRSADYMGRGMAVLGDLNDDGCDEIAIGSPRENAGTSDQGVVRVLFGYGGVGCPATPQMAVLASGVGSSRAGYSLDGGFDVDGDTVEDLVVGANNHYANGMTRGAVHLISGAYILSLPRIDVDVDVNANNVNPFQDSASTLNNVIYGAVNQENFGASVGLIVTSFGGTAKVMVGSTHGAMSGTLRSGGAQLFRYVNGVGFDPKPIAIFSGESNNQYNEIGRRMDTGMVGLKPMVVIGGIFGNGPGVDLGSVYTLDLSGL